MWEFGHLPNVGATAPGEPVDLPDKMGRMLNELEHAHIYTDQLHQMIGHLTKQVEELESSSP